MVSEDLKFHQDSCFSECQDRADIYVENYECLDDMTVEDSSGRNCVWYENHPEACGFFDTFGD